MNKKALFLIALTLVATATTIVDAVVIPEASTPISPNVTDETMSTTEPAGVQPLGETIGDPTAPGYPAKA